MERDSNRIWWRDVAVVRIEAWTSNDGHGYVRVTSEPTGGDTLVRTDEEFTSIMARSPGIARHAYTCVALPSAVLDVNVGVTVTDIGTACDE